MASIARRLKQMGENSLRSQGLSQEALEDVGPDELKHLTSGFRFPEARKQLTSVDWWLGAGKWSLKKAIKDGYSANEWVYVCINRVAQPASSVPWRVSRFTGSDRKQVDKNKNIFHYETKGMDALDRTRHILKATDILEPEPGHPLETLIDEPNPFMDNQALIESILQHLLLSGNSIITKVRSKKTPISAPGPLPGSPPLELWVINPDEITPKKDRKKFIIYYEAPVPGQREPEKVSVHDLLHLKLHNPGDPTWGISPLKSAAMVVDTDVQAVTWNKSSFENRAVPDGIFFSDTTGVLRQEDFEVQRQQLKSQYQGVDNARTPILAAGIKDFRQLSMTPVEMDFIRSRHLNRESICGIYGVDPRIAGILDVGAASNPKEIRRDHWISTVLPALDRIQSVLNRYLAREFGEDIYLWYDVRNVEALRESHHEKTRSAALHARNGVPYKALNRVYEFGFTDDEMEHLDKGYMPASTRSVEEINRAEEQARLNPNPQNPNSETPDGGQQIEDTPNSQPSPGQQDDPMDSDSNRKAIWDLTQVELWMDEKEIRSNLLAPEGDYLTCWVDIDSSPSTLAAVARGEVDGVTLLPLSNSQNHNVAELRFYSPSLIHKGALA